MDNENKHENLANVKDDSAKNFKEADTNTKDSEVKYEKINETGEKVADVAKNIKCKFDGTNSSTKKGIVAGLLATFIALLALIGFKSCKKKCDKE